MIKQLEMCDKNKDSRITELKENEEIYKMNYIVQVNV